MNQSVFTILQNTQLTASVHELKLRGDCSAITAPGQFVQVSVPGKFLRRPFSVCDCEGEGDVLTLCIQKAGAGTQALCAMEPGAQLDLLTGLGNGFDTRSVTSCPLLIGGGSGVGALYGLAKALVDQGADITVALGFRTAADVFYVNQFHDLGAEVYVYTEDASRGGAGLATDAVGLPHTELFACGPLGMLEALDAIEDRDAQFSLEARMGCGFGACMGCTIDTVLGAKRVCADGPVFPGKAVIW